MDKPKSEYERFQQQQFGELERLNAMRKKRERRERMVEWLKDDKNLDLLLKICRDAGRTFSNREYARKVLPDYSFRFRD